MKIAIRLSKQTLKQGQNFSAPIGHSAIWMRQGAVQQPDMVWSSGDGFYMAPESLIVATQPSEFVCFTVGAEAVGGDSHNELLSAEFEWPYQEYVLRLDTVTFPKGVVAYRHVHAGAGIRFLERGSLEIQSDSHSEQMNKGDAWFEDTNSPVKATGLSKEVTQFIRALVLPVEYLGKPTIKLLNPEDFDKPKLQTNNRFFDQHVAL